MSGSLDGAGPEREAAAQSQGLSMLLDAIMAASGLALPPSTTATSITKDSWLVTHL